MTDWRTLELDLATAKAAAVDVALEGLEDILPFLTAPAAQQVRVTQARLRDERNVLMSDAGRKQP